MIENSRHYLFHAQCRPTVFGFKCLAANNIWSRRFSLSFLPSLSGENGNSLHMHLLLPKMFIKKQTRWSNYKIIIKLGYRKIPWFVSVSQINYLREPSVSADNWSARGYISWGWRRCYIKSYPLGPLPWIRHCISTHKLEVSRNFLSIRIVLSCFYLLIFYFEKFST